MEYTVVFDVTKDGIVSWWFPAIGLIFVAIGSSLVGLRHSLPAALPKFFPFAFLGFALIWSLIAFGVTANEYSNLASALREGRCAVVEGVVTQFHPMPEAGHEMESFVVNGRRFQYSDYIVSPGFRNTSSHGGPVREGKLVRIHHLGNDIARLEIANQ